MLSRIVMAGSVLLLAGLALGVAYLLGMRKKDSLVANAQRRINRSVFNPRQMKSAGTPGAYAAVLRHVGRTSGRPYETPVGAVPTDDGFVIALVYGAGSDWLQNVLAAGSAVIVHEGQTHHVERPEVVPMEAASEFFSPSDQRGHRLYGVNQCLRVHRVTVDR